MKAYSVHIDQYFPVCGKGLRKPTIRNLPPVTAHQSSGLRGEHEAVLGTGLTGSSTTTALVLLLCAAQLQIAWLRFHAGSCHTSSSCCVQEELSQ